MKKFLLVFVLFAGVFALSACGPKTFEIAMITDKGDIDDKSFNQGTWEGIVEFATENNKTHKYYKPLEVSNTAYVDAIDLAVAGGAKIVVTPGFLFQEAVHIAQIKYPDVKFVLIDGYPHDGSWTPDVRDNTTSIFFKEHESAFLAGYAVVKDGFTNLGFFGGMAVPAVQRFGTGFVAGAYLAAQEMGVTLNFPATRYHYFGDFIATDEFKNMAASWYSSGTQMIHVAAGGAGNSVMAAAQEGANRWVVGVDVDQKDQSVRVVTSAMKGLATAVQKALTDFYADEFEGGEIITLGAAEDGVGLPLDFSRFTTFNQAAYDTLFAKLVDGTIVVPSNYPELIAFATAKGITADLTIFSESNLGGQTA
ncbi:MAG TPA: BMP family ABC transporter substrate-binding protein [Bacilli bacterium]|nr:BMP family ABC transporter substrate-binding protein [Bacilli bacterium]